MSDEALRDLAAVVDRVGADGTARTRAVRDAGGAVDRTMWRRFGELGWLGLGVPEELGGARAGERAVATVAGRLGAGGFPEPFAACAVRVATLLSELAGPAGPAEARRLLDDVVAGTRVVTLAHDPDAAAPTLTGDAAGGFALAGRVRSAGLRVSTVALADGALDVRERPTTSAEERSAAASGARARAGEAATSACRQAVHLHGALGFSDEHDLGLFLNRALVLGTWLGGPEAHRLRHDALTSRLGAAATPVRPAAAPALVGGDARPARPRFGVAQGRDWNALTDDEFRAVVRAEFEAHYPSSIRYPPRRLYWVEQSAWFERMAAKGWIAPNWPVRYGGMGLGPAKLLVFGEEQERWGIARFQDQGVRMIGPALFEHGTPEQLDRFLPGILSCADRYCQGYSEPGAGSDLASLRTRARRDGDHYVVDGSKIWTTMAHDVTHMLLLARTDPDARGRRGISFVLLELGVPDVTVRPIRDVAGHEELCEVFFDGVVIPAGNRIGPENRGWAVSRSVLAAERIHIGSPQLPAYALDRLDRVARARGLAGGPVFRSRFAALALDVTHLADAYAGFAAVFVRGEPLGPDVSMLEIWATETTQRIGELIRDTAGPAGAVVGPVGLGEGPCAEDLDVLDVFYKALPSTIYGGSNEIQRSIIATEVLGLPAPQRNGVR